MRGAFPFAKTCCKGERPHTMCGTYLLTSSLAAALPAERRVSARRGWAGEKVAFLSILQRCALVAPDGQANEFPTCPQSLSVG